MQKRKLPGWTSNGLVITVISVVLSGVVSYLVAHYQSRDAAKQAVSSQQAAAAGQLEAAATIVYQDVDVVTFSSALCGYSLTADTPRNCPEKPPSLSTYIAHWEVFDADAANISDPSTRALTAQLDDLGDEIGAEPQTEGLDNKFGDLYYKLIKRCGQIIQGQQ